MHYKHASVRKVHLVKGHVVYVYWIDTVMCKIIYQLNLVKGQFSYSKENMLKMLLYS